MVGVTSIVLADNERLMREALRFLVSQEPFFRVTAETGSGIDLPVILQEHNPEILILDRLLPATGAGAVIAGVRAMNLKTRTIVLGSGDSDAWAQESLRAGADGVCVKEGAAEEITAAIWAVLEGKSYLSPELSGGSAGPQQKFKALMAMPPLERLTRRELEILKMVACGMRNRDIAGTLSISSKTVEKHRSNIMLKIGLHTSSRLTAFAMQIGLVSGQSQDCRF
jgi:DNA-binding NarL/FixJ family response regulator